MRGNASEVWDGKEGGVVWCSVDKGTKEKAKEGCALFMAPTVREDRDEQGWKGSRAVWAARKLRIIKYTWVCAYAPVNMRRGNGIGEMRKF